MQTCDLRWEELDQVGGALGVHVPGIAGVDWERDQSMGKIRVAKKARLHLKAPRPCPASRKGSDVGLDGGVTTRLECPVCFRTKKSVIRMNIGGPLQYPL